MWPSHYTSWIIEVKPSTPLLPNKSQDFSASLFPLLLPSLASLLMVLFLNFDLWQRIRSPVSEGNMRFIFFPTLLELILRNYGPCNPAAHASLVMAGGRMFEGRLTAHTHVYTHTFTDYNTLLDWSPVRRVVWWFWQHVIAYSTLVQLNQWKDYECVSNEWRTRERSLFNVFPRLL